MHIKQVGIMVAIFGVIFGVVYAVMSGMFSAASSQTDVTVDVQKLQENIVWKSDIPQKWQDRYKVRVLSVVDEKRDDDEDGLTLLQEYQYGTNPHAADSDNDGYPDGQEVENGYSPAGDGLLDKNGNGVSDAWEVEKFGAILDDDADVDADKDGLSLLEEYHYNTDPTRADTDGDGYADGREVQHGYDPDAPGDARIKMTMVIKKINVEVPIVLSADTDEARLQKDLESGVIHYPGTPMPGQRGNVYIAGHSSNYAWSKGRYNYVFKNLNDLVEDDEISIVTRTQNGTEITHTYVVTSKEEVNPDDVRIFSQSQMQELTLTTCWPLGTSTRRLMIKAYLQEV